MANKNRRQSDTLNCRLSKDHGENPVPSLTFYTNKEIELGEGSNFLKVIELTNDRN